MQSNNWKTILYLLLAVVSMQLMSCRPSPQYPEALLVADSLTQCNADSAVRLLQEVAPTMLQAQEPVRRYHQEEGDPCLLPEAYYYAGRVTRDLGDAPQALDYAILIGRSYTAVYTSQNRLLRKVFPQGSSYNSWADFISVL